MSMTFYWPVCIAVILLNEGGLLSISDDPENSGAIVNTLRPMPEGLVVASSDSETLQYFEDLNLHTYVDLQDFEQASLEQQQLQVEQQLEQQQQLEQTQSSDDTDSHALAALQTQADDEVQRPSFVRDRFYGEVLAQALEFVSGLKKLLADHDGLKAGMIPVIDGVEFEYDPNNARRVVGVNIPFSDRHGRITQVRSDNPQLIRFLRSWDKIYQTLRLSYVFPSYDAQRPGNNTLELRTDLAESEQLDGLNRMFVVQSLIGLLKQQEATHGASGLATALEIHHWLFSVQMAHGVITDSARLFLLVRQGLNESKVLVASSASLTRSLSQGFKLFEGAGLVLMPIYLGLDVYQLTQAQSVSQQIVFATQLTLDTLNTAVSVAAIGAGLIGATTAASLLGGVGVIGGGLTIGLIGLGSAYAQEYQSVHQVGAYFAQIDQGYRLGGYRYDPDSNSLIPYAGAVIDEVDLRGQRLSFGSQTLQSVQHHANATGSGEDNYYFWAGDQPLLESDPAKALNVREGLGYLAHLTLPAVAPSGQAASLILPTTPNNYIRYPDGWAGIPGITADHSAGLDVLRRLEGENFDFDYYMFPMERAIKKVVTDYQALNITIKLDRRPRQLVMPSFNRVNRGLIGYQLRGQGGQYQLALEPGARSIRLSEDGDSGSLWTLSSAQGAERIEVMSGGFKIDGIEVSLSAMALALEVQVYVIDAHQDVFVLDFANQQAVPSSEDLAAVDQTQLQTHLEQLAADYELGSYILLRNYRTAADDPASNVGNAYYDVKNDRILYTDRADQRAAVLDQAKLVGDQDDRAFFMTNKNTLQLWETRIKDGQVLYQYADGFSLESHNNLVETQSFSSANGAGLILLQRRRNTLGEVIDFSYRLGDGQMQLVAISGAAEAVSNLLNEGLYHSALHVADAADEDYAFAQSARDKARILVRPAVANVVSVSLEDTLGQPLQRGWLVRARGANVTPELRLMRRLIPQWPEGTSMPTDLGLVSDGQSSPVTADGYYLYSHIEQRLYRQTIDADTGLSTADAQSVLANVAHVYVDAGRVFAELDNGLIARFDDEGQDHVWVAVTPARLRVADESAQDALDNMVKAYQAIAALEASSSEGGGSEGPDSKGDNSKIEMAKHLSLLGLTDRKGEALHAWFERDRLRLIVADPVLSAIAQLTLLQVRDDDSVLLYDPQGQVLYQQPIGEMSLDDDFDDSMRLLDANSGTAEQHERPEATALTATVGRVVSVQMLADGQFYVTNKEGLTLSLTDLDKPLLVEVSDDYVDLRDDSLMQLKVSLDKQGQYYRLAAVFNLHHRGLWYFSTTGQLLDLNSDDVFSYLGRDKAGAYYFYNHSQQRLERAALAAGLEVGEPTRTVLKGQYRHAQVTAHSLLLSEASQENLHLSASPWASSLLLPPALQGLSNLIVDSRGIEGQVTLSAEVLATYADLLLISVPYNRLKVHLAALDTDAVYYQFSPSSQSASDQDGRAQHSPAANSRRGVEDSGLELRLLYPQQQDKDTYGVLLIAGVEQRHALTLVFDPAPTDARSDRWHDRWRGAQHCPRRSDDGRHHGLLVCLKRRLER